MVRAYLPQFAAGNINANTINPPQGFLIDGGVIPTVFIRMLFEDGKTMIYEDNNIMAYEGPKAVPANWFDESFRDRVLITIKPSQVPSTQTDFPFLFNSILSELEEAQSAGQDIRFASEDGLTEFNVEVQQIETTMGTQNSLIAWANIPSISDGITFYMYFNNPNASAFPTPQDTWDANYKGVWHMNQIVSGVDSIKDSTANNNDLTDNGSPILGVVGKIGNAIEFNGTNQDLKRTGATLPLGDSSYTYSTWINPDTDGVKGMIGYGDYSAISGSNAFRLGVGTNIHNYWFGNDLITPTISPSYVGSFHYLVASYTNGGLRRIYYDGLEVASDTPGTLNIVAPLNFAVGSTLRPPSSEFFDGIEDEVRVSDIAKSADFILTEFNNQNIPLDFYGVGPVERLDNIPADWFNPQFKKRVLVTIQATQITGTHTDYPFLFNQTFTELIGNMKANGEDIRFTSVDGQTVFPVEIQSANNTTGELIAWSKIPSISGTTTFYMYFDNPNAIALDPKQVWPIGGLNYVYHMNQSPATILDSTTNSEIAVGTEAAVAGKIGNATLFPGNSDIETFLAPDSRAATCGNTGWLSMWLKPTGNLIDDQFVTMFFNNKWGVLLGFQDNKWNLFRYPAIPIETTEIAADLNVFVKLDFLITPGSPNQVRMYKDGVEIAATPIDDGEFANRLGSTKLVFGSFESGAFYTGVIDEFRFLDTVPDIPNISDRVNTIFNNENSPTTFYSLGPVRSIC